MYVLYFYTIGSAIGLSTPASPQTRVIDSTVCTALKARTSAYDTGLTSADMSGYKATSYELRKAVKVAKRHYRDKVESHF